MSRACAAFRPVRRASNGSGDVPGSGSVHGGAGGNGDNGGSGGDGLKSSSFLCPSSRSLLVTVAGGWCSRAACPVPVDSAAAADGCSCGLFCAPCCSVLAADSRSDGRKAGGSGTGDVPEEVPSEGRRVIWTTPRDTTGNCFRLPTMPPGSPAAAAMAGVCFPTPRACLRPGDLPVATKNLPFPQRYPKWRLRKLRRLQRPLVEADAFRLGFTDS